MFVMYIEFIESLKKNSMNDNTKLFKKNSNNKGEILVQSYYNSWRRLRYIHTVELIQSMECSSSNSRSHLKLLYPINSLALFQVLH